MSRSRHPVPSCPRASSCPTSPTGECSPRRCRGDPVVAVRRGEEVFVLGASCGHYGAPLWDGVFLGNEVRCPWHHARFDVRTGEAVNPPSPRGIPTWLVVREGSRVRTGARREATAAKTVVRNTPSSVLIVGAGGAGDACAEQLRRRGYDGPITLVAKDGEGWPIDRPNISKDVLAGSAPDEWLPIRGGEYYEANRIELIEGEVTRLDPGGRVAHLAGGRSIPYGVALLATGASAIRLPIPGADLPHVHLLRTLPDMKGIIAALRPGQKAVVIGASFIGLEVAAALAGAKGGGDGHRAGQPAPGARPRRGGGNLHPVAARGEGRAVPPRPEAGEHRRVGGDLRRRLDGPATPTSKERGRNGHAYLRIDTFMREVNPSHYTHCHSNAYIKNSERHTGSGILK